MCETFATQFISLIINVPIRLNFENYNKLLKGDHDGYSRRFTKERINSTNDR